MFRLLMLKINSKMINKVSVFFRYFSSQEIFERRMKRNKKRIRKVKKKDTIKIISEIQKDILKASLKGKCEIVKAYNVNSSRMQIVAFRFLRKNRGYKMHKEVSNGYDVIIIRL